ncbi:RNA-binding protein [Candidatus Bathyarchaeota archaeon]|nr:RNA-binding protein [Candidatus Bathyarchaeota archaeon]
MTKFSQQLKTTPEKLFGTKIQVESTEARGATVYLINGRPLIALHKDILLPTLRFEDALNRLPKAIVNMGAISHICNGADVMAPGIVQFEGKFEADEFLLIIDERHRKPLAIGKALFDSEHARALKRGKIVKNLHYVGDTLWKLLKQFLS